MSVFRGQRWSDAVTVYHRSVTKDSAGKSVTNWTREVFSGCFYGLAKSYKVSGQTLAEVDVHCARIPAMFEPYSLSISAGDVIVRGECLVEIPANSSAEKLLADTEHFTVDVFKDNTQLRLTAHYYAGE